MRVLITGIGGFAGQHLTAALRARGHEPVGFDQATPTWAGCPPTTVGDIRDPDAVHHLFRRIKPQACIHLAAISSVPDAEKNLALLFDINVAGTLHILNAVRTEAHQCRLLVVSSSQVYGTDDAGVSLDENAALRPSSSYAVSKVAADTATLGYAARFGLHALTARPTNHTGPGQSENFVVASFVRQMSTAKNQACRIKAGNLDCVRSFLDVRDVTRAYVSLIEKGHPAIAYNIAPASNIRIGVILDMLAAQTGCSPLVEVDPALYRPTDAVPLLTSARIKKHTGWEPLRTLKETLTDMLVEGS